MDDWSKEEEEEESREEEQEVERTAAHGTLVRDAAAEGSPFQLVNTSMWALPVWGGGLNPCPDGLGHFFREEFSKFKRAFA